MRFRPIFLLASSLCLPLAATAAGKYSWFDEAPVGSASKQQPSTVGIEVYRSTDDPTRDSNIYSEHRISLFGDYSRRAARVTEDSENPFERRFANFGVRWQHRVSSKDSLSLQAEQGDSALLRPALTANPDALDTRATLAWTRELPLAWKPSVTGGVFFGDESTRDEAPRFMGRRYYGFSVGGELRLLESHRPYVSFRMERSLYEASAEDPLATGLARTTATEDSSRLAAGWRWQAARGLSLQAEASYGMNFNNGNSDVASPVERERSRVFFGTRFDFR